MSRIRRSWILFLAVALCIGVLAGGATVARATFPTSPGSTAPPILRWSNEGVSDLLTLDPAQGPDFNARQAVQLIFGGLVRFGAGSSIVPDTAQQWTTSRDGLTYTFYLRPAVRFGDGTPVTAADVAFSLNRVLSPRFAGQNGATFLEDIRGARDVISGRARTASGIQVIGARVLRIRLAYPSGSFLSKLANPAGFIVPPHAVRRDPLHWDQHAFGTGPFMVSRWIHNDALLLKPNPYYYGGRLKLGGVAMSFIPEQLAAYKWYREGAVDVMGTIHFPTEMLYDVQNRTDFHQSPRLEVVYLPLNTKRWPFTDARVRLAFARALNKDAIVRNVYVGFAHATNGMMPPGLPGYDPGYVGPSYAPSTARALLAAAGFARGKRFPVVDFPIDATAESMVLATELANQWERTLGVRVHLHQYDHTSYLGLLQRNNYEIAVIDWTVDYPDPEDFLSLILHSGNSNNNSQWTNSSFDRLVDRGDRMTGETPQRFARYRRAEALAMESAPVIPLVNPYAGILLSSTVHGLQVRSGYLLAPDWTKVRVTASDFP